MSSSIHNTGPGTYPRLDRTSVLRVLVPADRRRMMGELLDWPAPVEERALAASIAAEEQDAPVAEVVESDAAITARAKLDQVHLPALAEANLVSWDRSSETVAPTDHPAFRDPMIQRLLRDDSGEADDVVDALADRQRRTALAVLKDQSEPIPVDDLANEIAIRLPDPTIGIMDVLVSLRHAHLPKLDDAGLIDYDREGGTVAYRGHPAVDGPWFGWGRGGRAGSDSSTGDPTNHETE